MTIITKKQLPSFRKGWHKYHAKRSKCLYGHYHPSILEAGVCNQLLAKVKDRTIKAYQYQPKYPLYVNDKLICTHYPDFFILHNDGSTEIVEAKGIIKAVWRIKKKLFEALHPDIPYRIITKGTNYDNFRNRIR